MSSPITLRKRSGEPGDNGMGDSDAILGACIAARDAE